MKSLPLALAVHVAPGGSLLDVPVDVASVVLRGQPRDMREHHVNQRVAHSTNVDVRNVTAWVGRAANYDSDWTSVLHTGNQACIHAFPILWMWVSGGVAGVMDRTTDVVTHTPGTMRSHDACRMS